MSNKFLISLFVLSALLVFVRANEKGKSIEEDDETGSPPRPLEALAPLQPLAPMTMGEAGSRAQTHGSLLSETEAEAQLESPATGDVQSAADLTSPQLDVTTEEAFQIEFIKSLMNNVRNIETRYNDDQNSQLEHNDEWTLGLARIRNGMRSQTAVMSPKVKSMIDAFLEEKPIRGEIFKLMMRLETLIMEQVERLLAIEEQVPETEFNSLAQNDAYMNRLVDLFTLEETGQNVLPDRYFKFIRNDRRAALVETRLLIGVDEEDRDSKML